MSQTPDLPIESSLPALVQALKTSGRAVLQAPPGAGKTTKVPLALLAQAKLPGKIIMLEPRRVAARASAERMAQMLGEEVGQTVGYRVRGDSKTSPSTRIEVVTEGILTRMLQSDPDLPGISAILFDEFHERALTADLGLALSFEARDTLRPDLWLLVMSATLDAAPVAKLLGDAPMITSEGRAFPVDTRFLEKPRGSGADRFDRLCADTADLVRKALAETEGGVLVFLPGAGEIRRTSDLLAPTLPSDVKLQTLYGGLPLAQQRAALRPLDDHRKLVLATAIAETSLTIPDIRVVVDAGRARRASYDPGSGMTRLVTEPVSRAEAEQRQGRAGRVAPGTCYRLWTRGQQGALPAAAPPEIMRADLASLALDLAAWGTPPDDLAFLTPPPAAALSEARSLCRDLGALDETGGLTPHGARLAKLPLHPRLAHMLTVAGKDAADLAALLSGRPLPGTAADMTARLRLLKGGNAPEGQRGAVAELRAEAKRLRGVAPKANGHSAAQMLALAYPDRIAMRRPGDDPRYLLSGGKGARLDPADGLAGQRILVAADLDGDAREVRIRAALPMTESELRALYGDRISWQNACHWDKRHRRVIARQQERLEAIVLAEQNWKDAPPEYLALAVLEGFRDLGLPISKGAQRLIDRINRARQSAPALPDARPDSLMATAEDWLLPFISDLRTAADIQGFDILPALQNLLGWEGTQTLDRLLPARFTTPLGNTTPIDYASDPPGIAVRLQELFGQTTHPSILNGTQPLKLTLLSPARRPIAVTSDLPGFWAGSYADVRRDMRSQYPKHPWPEDPTQADPTLRAKPRK